MDIPKWLGVNMILKIEWSCINKKENLQVYIDEKKLSFKQIDNIQHFCNADICSSCNNCIKCGYWSTINGIANDKIDGDVIFSKTMHLNNEDQNKEIMRLINLK